MYASRRVIGGVRPAALLRPALLGRFLPRLSRRSSWIGGFLAEDSRKRMSLSVREGEISLLRRIRSRSDHP